MFANGRRKTVAMVWIPGIVWPRTLTWAYRPIDGVRTVYDVKSSGSGQRVCGLFDRTDRAWVVDDRVCVADQYYCRCTINAVLKCRLSWFIEHER